MEQGEEKVHLEFTGERLIPEHTKDDLIYYEHLSRYIFASQFVKSKTVLDIACGVGYGSELLIKNGALKVIGVDVDADAIAYAKQNYQAEDVDFVVGNAQEIPLPEKSVDLIVAFETIEHLEDYKKFLAETSRVLSEDGLLIISTPNNEVYSENPFHTKEFSLPEFKEVLGSRYRNVEILYQNNLLASTVSKGALLKTNDLDQKYEIQTLKAGTRDFNKSLYLVALCSNSELPEFEENILLDGGKALEKLYRHINELQEEKDQILQELEDTTEEKNVELQQKGEELKKMQKEIDDANSEINRIHTSHSWKATAPFRRIRPLAHDFGKFAKRYLKK